MNAVDWQTVTGVYRTMATTATEVQRDVSSELPDREFEWGSPVEVNGVTVVPNTDRARFPPSDNITYVSPQTIGYIVDGVEDYLDEHAEQEFEIPETYSAMGEFEGYICCVSASGGKYGFGFGPEQIEAGVRLATGGGRYSADDVTAFGCGDRAGVFRGPEGDFLFAPQQVPEFEADSAHAYPTYDIAGMEIPEKRDDIRAGIDTLAEVFPEIDGRSLASHEAVVRSNHKFVMESGDTLRISGQDLRRLNGLQRDSDEIIGHAEKDIELAPYEPEHEITADDLEYRLGDEILAKEVIGFKRDWDITRHRATSRDSGIMRIDLNIEYIGISIPENGRMHVQPYDRTVKTWKP